MPDMDKPKVSVVAADVVAEGTPHAKVIVVLEINGKKYLKTISVADMRELS